MSRTGVPLRCSRWSLIASFGLVTGCASVVGLDDLDFDLGDGGAGPAGPSSTATGDAATTSGTSDASSSSAAPSTVEASSSGSGGDGGDGGSGGSGGSPPTGFVVTGDHTEYRDLLHDYAASIWHLGEPEGDDTADDDGNADYTYDATYLAEEGTLTYEVPGIFATDTAVTFAGGARAEVPIDADYYNFHLRYDNGPFTLMFFAKLDGPPAEPLVVASCFGEDSLDGRDKGFRVLLSDEVLLELHGSNNLDVLTHETFRFDFPADGAWHFVIVERRRDRAIRGYLDGAREMEGTSSIVAFPATEGLYSMGAEAGAAPATEAVTLDEVAMVYDELGQDKVTSLLACLQGLGCFRPDE